MHCLNYLSNLEHKFEKKKLGKKKKDGVLKFIFKTPKKAISGKGANKIQGGSPCYMSTAQTKRISIRL